MGKTVTKTLSTLVPDFKSNQGIPEIGSRLYEYVEVPYKTQVADYYDKYMKIGTDGLLNAQGGINLDSAKAAGFEALKSVNGSFKLSLPVDYLERVATTGRWDMSPEMAVKYASDAAGQLGLIDRANFGVNQAAKVLGLSGASVALNDVPVSELINVSTRVVDSLGDGEISTSEAKNLGGTVAGIVGSTVGAVFGPVGSAICGFVCSTIGSAIGSFVADITGQSEKERRAAIKYRQDVTAANFFYSRQAATRQSADVCVKSYENYFKYMDACYSEFFRAWEQTEFEIGWRFGLRFQTDWLGTTDLNWAHWGDKVSKPKSGVQQTAFSSEDDRIKKLLGTNGIWGVRGSIRDAYWKDGYSIPAQQGFICIEQYGCPYPKFDTGIFKGNGPNPKGTVSGSADRVTQAFLRMGIPYVPRDKRYEAIKSAVDYYSQQEYDNWDALHPVKKGETRTKNVYKSRPTISEVDVPSACLAIHRSIYSYADIANPKNQTYAAGRTHSTLPKVPFVVADLDSLALKYKILRRDLTASASSVAAQQEAWLNAATYQNRGFAGNAVTRALSMSKGRNDMIGNLMLVGGLGALAFSMTRRR